jgi:hypothetical protein
MKQYRKNKGNNDHHTKALKKYDFDNVTVVYQQCPLYLMDVVEIFLIAFFDLMNRDKGYNKTTGGRKGYRVSTLTRVLLSAGRMGVKNHMFGRKGVLNPILGNTWQKTPEQIAKTSGENNGMFGNGHLISGENHPLYGKFGADHPSFCNTWQKTQEHIAKTSGENNGMFGIKGIDNPTYGIKNGQAKQICVFGKLYGAASDASNTLREVCNTRDKGNFIKTWATRKNMYNVFYVIKDFYELMCDKEGQITREMYDDWLSSNSIA